MESLPQGNNEGRLKKSNVQKVDKIIAQLFAQRGYGEVLGSAELQQVWQQTVGQPMAEKSRPGKVRNGILDVFVGNSAINQELTFRRREIVKQLSEKLPDHKITDLRIRVG